MIEDASRLFRLYPSFSLTMRTILGHNSHKFSMFETIKCGPSIRSRLLDYEDDFGQFFFIVFTMFKDYTVVSSLFLIIHQGYTMFTDIYCH